MQFVEFHRESGEMEYHFGLAKAFLEGYYGVEGSCLYAHRIYELLRSRCSRGFMAHITFWDAVKGNAL